LTTTSITKSIFVSSGRVFLYQGLGLLLGFGFQAFISNTCGATGVGAFTLFVSWLGILSLLTVPGLEATLVYFLPRYEEDPASRRYLVQLCLGIVGCTALLTALVLLGAGDSLFRWVGLPGMARVPFAFSIIVFSFGKLLDSVFLGMKDAPAIGYYNSVRTIIRFILCLPVFFFPASSWRILFFSVACEGAITLYFKLIKIRGEFPGVLQGNELSFKKVETKHSSIRPIVISMFGISIVDNLYPFMDKAILGVILSLEFVGIYRISESLASLVSLFVSPFIVFWPFISKLYAEDRLDELRDAYRNINLVIIAMMIPFLLILVEGADFGLSLFGAAFVHHGRAVFLVLTLGYVVDAVAGPAGSVLKMTRYSRLSFLINMVLLAIYVVLGFLFTTKYGLIGAALAKTTVMVLGNVTNVIANRLLLGIFPYSYQHAWLIGTGVGILAIRSFFPNHQLTTTAHGLVALAETTVFCIIVFLVLGKQLFLLKNKMMNLISTRTNPS